MVKQYKIDAVKELTEKLSSQRNIILTNYSGVKDVEMRKLRIQLREKGAGYKVVRNNFFRKALKDAGFAADFDASLKGPIAVAFMDDQVGEIAKVFKEFKKEQDKFSFFLGMIEGVVFDEKNIQKLADLPTKEGLLCQIAGGMNQVMASVARGIQAVAEKNGDAA
ncbi:MAG: 50S ribosomal protein L10 [Spirochaetota bacterium]